MSCNNCQECNPCSQPTCVENHDCECKIFLKSDCIEEITEEMPYLTITAGKTFNEWISALNDALQDKFTPIENFFKLKNVGAGVGKIYKGISILGEKEIKSIKGTDLITVNNLTDEVEIEVNESALIAFIGDSNTYSVANVGTGANVYKDSTVVGLNTQFNLKKIKSSDGSVTITEGTDDINLLVNDSDTTYSAGTGLSLVETTFNNTSPDQVVVLTQGGATTITGTYPNFTISSTDTNTTYSAGTAISLVGTTFNNTAPDQTVTLTQGGATTITGTYPNFTISSTDTNTTYSAGNGLVLTGTVFSVENLQKVITYPADFTGTNYTLTNADNNYEIIIDNGATAVSITVPSGLISKIGVGFTQKGTGDISYTASGTTINNPIGLKIKGQYYQTFLSQELATNNYFLGGNTKV